MKKLFYFFSASVMLLAACSNNESKTGTNADSTNVTITETTEAPQTGRYGIKSGIVTYEPYELMGVKVYQTTYFDDYGNKEAQESTTEMEMMGMKTKQRNMSIMADGYSITYQLENMVNNKNELKKVAKKTKFVANPLGFDVSTFSDEIKKRYDYKEMGTESVAGVEGTKISFTMDKTKSESRISCVIYKNIMLKTEMNMSGIQMNIKAKTFEQNASVPADKFEIPEGYTVEEK